MSRERRYRSSFLLLAALVLPFLVVARYVKAGPGAPGIATSRAVSSQADPILAATSHAASSHAASKGASVVPAKNIEPAVDCPGAPITIFSASTTPANPHYDDRPVTLGVKFRSDTDGLVTGVRFYKDALDSGVHIGQLWTSDGTLLASATYTETASGWQQVDFASPVPILANTTYIASDHTTTGYPQDVGVFTASGVDNPPLHALRDGEDGGNGVYHYDSPVGESGFPDQSFGGSNWYVDVVLAPTVSCDDGNPCTDDSCDPVRGCVHTPAADGTTCDDGNACTTGDMCSGGVCVPGATTIFSDATTPANPHFGDRPVTLGVKFRSDVNAFVAGVRFYKDALDNGTHIGQLWAADGTLLASATYTETASGWQQVTFASAVPITANTTYVASNHTTTGYPQDLNYFTASGVDHPPLHALRDGEDGGNGVYGYDAADGTSRFPDQSFGGSNYYVDVMLAATVSCDDGNPCTDDTCDPAGGCVHTPVTDGTSCDDGNACTHADSCQAGVCAGSPVVCNASDQCHDAGVCDPGTGACSDPAKSDGTACSDGNACTQTDTCQGGVCAGANPVVCDASDQCHVAGVCDPASGVCSRPTKPDGSACSDGDACTQTDTCQAGVCAGANPVVCIASDQCHVSACDHGTGACLDQPAPDGTSCTDANACTTGDVCRGGACVPGPGPQFGATLFPDSTTPANPYFTDQGVRVGVKFQSEVAGFIAGVRFYKDPRNNGTHIGELWTAGGTLLASVVFSESPSGWQQANFVSPVPIAANTTYVAAYHTTTGYAQDLDYFTAAGVDSPPLHALQDGVAGGNGVYKYDPPRDTGGFPDQSAGASNYYVDAVFNFGVCDDGDVCTSDSCNPATGCAHGPATLSEVRQVVFQDNDTTLQWAMTFDATHWNTYRGTIPAHGLGSRPAPARYDHTCFEKGDALLDGEMLSTDIDNPPEGTGFYYLISGRNDTCAPMLESTLGFDSAMHEIPNAAPCQ